MTRTTVPREIDPRIDPKLYAYHYRAGWNTAERNGCYPTARDNAIDRNVPDAWLDGWSDYCEDRVKYHSRQELIATLNADDASRRGGN